MPTRSPPPSSVLLLIDMQKSIDLMQADKSHANPGWGGRNNLSAEAQVMRLLAHWRRAGWPVWHVRHDSPNPKSHYRPGQPGNDFKPDVAPISGELVIAKTTNSAFIGTDLETRLRSENRPGLVVVGLSTNNSVEATVRMAGNLGFETYVVADGTFTYGMKDWSGVPRTADEVHAMALANMDGEYCTVVTTSELIGEGD